jgi:hypothetical protein
LGLEDDAKPKLIITITITITIIIKFTLQIKSMFFFFYDSNNIYFKFNNIYDIKLMITRNVLGCDIGPARNENVVPPLRVCDSLEC